MFTLAQTMLYPMMQEQTTKGLFGKPKIQFGAFLQIGGFVYESSALISRALVDKSLILEQIIGAPEAPGDALTYVKTLARMRKESFPDQTTFGMLIMKSELQKLGLSMGFDSLKMTTKAMQKKMNVDDISPIGELFCLEGIGFGLEFPEETRDMYRNTYEEFDEQGWERAHQAGLDIPENPTVYPLEQRQNDALSLVAMYVHEFRPDLEDSLGLGHLLD